MAAGMDIMSAPDKSGRRWIEVRYLRGKFYEKDLNAIEKDIKQMLIGILADVQEAGYIRRAPQRGSNISNKKMAIHWRNLGYQIKDDGRTPRCDSNDGIHARCGRRILPGRLSQS